MLSRSRIKPKAWMKQRNSNLYVPKQAQLYQAAVVAGGCAICQKHYDEFALCLFHHGKFNRGMGQKKDHMIGFGLCFDHHDAGIPGTSFHAGRDPWEERFGYEREIYVWNNKRLDIPLQPEIRE